MSAQPESWGKYPEPHYDEDDICQCPDHVVMRQSCQDYGWPMLRSIIERDEIDR